MVPEDSFTKFYLEEYGQVFSTTYLLVRDRAAAEDVTQESFARALARWRRLRLEPWAGAWVMRTAINLCRRRFRQDGRLVPLSERPDSGDHHASDSDQAIDLWSAVAHLPVRQQQAIVLHYRADLPVDVIANVMGCRASSVRAHLTRGREGLRRALGGENDEPGSPTSAGDDAPVGP